LKIKLAIGFYLWYAIPQSKINEKGKPSSLNVIKFLSASLILAVQGLQSKTDNLLETTKSVATRPWLQTVAGEQPDASKEQSKM
jgi:hypothetical protein